MKKLFSLLFIATFLSVCFSSFSATSANIKETCTVKFTFDGLQVIAFGNPTKASAGILDVHHHTPNIKITKTTNGKTSLVNEITINSLTKNAFNVVVHNTGLNQLKPITKAPTRFTTANMSSNLSDFRWCLDMENDLFQKTLYLKENSLASKIHFYGSGIEFYADKVSDSKYKFYSNEGKRHAFNRQIGTPAARLELHDNERLTISSVREKIDIPYQAGVSYQVDITNLPPKDMMNIDHFAYYYDVFASDVERFMPVEAKKVVYRPAPFLCEAVILGKSAIN